MTNHLINVGLDTSSKSQNILQELEKSMAVKSKRLFGSKGSRGTHVLLEDLNLPMSSKFYGLEAGN
jgi:hypothetical protein